MREAIGDASVQYGAGRGLFFIKRQKEKELTEAQRELQKVGKKKHDSRMEISKILRNLQDLGSEYQIDTDDPEVIMEMVEKERVHFFSFVRYLSRKKMGQESLNTNLGRVLWDRSLGEITEEANHEKILTVTRIQLFRTALRAQELISLRTKHEELIEEYGEALAKVDKAQSRLIASSQRITDVQRTTEEVHSQVLRLQSQLARIDARLRSKAERDLIAKGLLEANPGIHSSGDIASSVKITWPVFGRITASFMAKGYQKFFGIPHRGMDIAVSQGTVVHSAEDGIVFLARDGGARGYSYVLVGHRDGYATLYGHLSSIAVSTGQEISKGQAIGLSGGTPGTYGAGPTTTGPHLHFEVIRSGTHVNPQSVL